MLVNMIDRLLEILRNEPEYRAFHLDSQTVVLEDYLEARPHRRDLLKRLIGERRILVGPWYILPEEFQVGGENLIRNLLRGHRIARAFGHVMKVGYSPFSWGQISQLPQIYQGFGIDGVMFYRGINSLDSPKAEFIWEGADGTRVLSSRFSTMPRYNFYFYIYRPVIHNEQVADIEYPWNRGGQPFHFADPELYREDYRLLRPNNDYFKGNVKPSVEKIIKEQAHDFTTPHIFWAEGHDSSGPNPKTVRLIKDADACLEHDEVRHSTFESYLAELKAEMDPEKLKLVHGERRSSQYDHRSGNLYGYTTSARMYLKQMNFDTERWLQLYAEPFNGMAGLLGLDTNDRYLELAWQRLLQNSAHDSIGGCSLDDVHDDMVNRYKQCREIARGVFGRACRHLAKQLDLTSYPEDSLHLAAVNPNTFTRNEIVEAYIDVPETLDRDSFILKDRAGEAIEVQILSKTKVEPVLEQMIDRPMYFSMMRYHCFIRASELPAFGLKTWQIVPAGKEESALAPLGSQQNDRPVLENRFIKVEVNKDGTLNIFDKENGQLFERQAYFYDEGEAGHAWVHDAAGPFITSLKQHAQCALKMNGPLAATTEIRLSLAVPRNLEARRNNGHHVDLAVTMEVTLKADSRRVALVVHTDNTAESHRLRLMFPLNLNAPYSYAEGQFDVVRRATHRPDTSDWVEQPMYDYPMHHFVDVSNGTTGAAVIVDGLKEYEVQDDPDQTLAITLFRAFRYVVQPSSFQDYSDQKGSQCLGRQTFRMAFLPHAGDWQEGGVYQEALNFNNSVRLFQTGRSAGSLSPDISLMSIEPEELIFSAFKPAESEQERSYILRLYNPTDHSISGRVSFFNTVRRAVYVNLEEQLLHGIEPERGNTIPVQAQPKKIVTVKILFEEAAL